MRKEAERQELQSGMAFHRIKVQFGYCKIRYEGIFKNDRRIVMLFGLANLFIEDCHEKRNRKVAEAIMAMPVAS